MNSMTYRYWKLLQAVIGILTVFSAVSGEISAWPVILISLLYINMAVLAVSSGKEILRLSNFITLTRTFGTVPLIYLSWDSPRLWPAVLVYLILLELTDLADGFAARRSGPTLTGARLDEETDAVFTLILAYLLFSKAGFGSWVLAFGAIRYIFVLLFLLTGTAEKYPQAFSRFSRFTCACTVSALIGAFAFFLPLPVRSAALAAALLMLAFSFLWETKIHLRRGPAAAFLGLTHSFIIYYLIPLKRRRMQKLYSEFLKPGSLAFDIGSHIGNRIGAWSGLGVRIVALEPAPLCIKIIKTFHGRRGNLTLIQAAAGEKKGAAVLHIDPLHPTLNTLSEKWIEQVKKTGPFDPVEWTETVNIDVTTLDELIKQFGIPDFCKIDVEGFELEVLKGLSSALPALSVEYLPSAAEMAEECLDRIILLGNYELNLSEREKMRFMWADWRDDNEVRKFLQNLPIKDSAGDIYARLKRSDN